MQDQLTRRQLLKTGGVAATTPAFFGPFASDDDEQRDNSLEYDGDYPVPPDHITVRDDLDDLREYQPAFSYEHMTIAERQEAQAKARGLYGWIAESDEHDVTAYYYWFRHQTQHSAFAYVGLDWGPDEHYLDHEPTIVFVRDDDDTVDTIVTTGGHHYGLWIDGEWGPMSEHYVSDRETHVNLMVIRPWNHYMEAPTTNGEFIEDFRGSFGSFREIRTDWYDEGRFKTTNHRAIEDPFVFWDEDRHHWWDDGTCDAWAARNIWIRLGLSEGTSRARLRFEER
ncbi:hypothetical protein [Natronorubrum daqingense]|uniref:Uncharacterized protein n=1 Tax=Natronorubrum daqingense TaxID=588898 RepID=A0A1N7FXZ0_9EURY|nr:hypothetical protein [Natronorubrum daqingense]APX98551.1 hypothetical protein BB347_17755 [Natronorubrum daqingense]SIS05191.1 hypothetical protein SAMN05421809_3557 [Natronorubrum daqingense]